MSACFSKDCRKFNNIVITSTNRNKSKHRDKPIRIPRNYLKHAQAQENLRLQLALLVWFSFSLVVKLPISQSLSVASTIMSLLETGIWKLLYISSRHSIIRTAALRKTLGHLQLKGQNTNNGGRSLLCSNLSSLEEHFFTFPVRSRFSLSF